MDFNVKIIGNDTEEDRILNTFLVSEIRDKYVEIGDEKFVLPIHFQENWEKINKFEVRDNDVYVSGHMKTGTTWLYEIVHLIVNGVKSRNDNPERIKEHLFLDWPICYGTAIKFLEIPAMTDTIGFLNNIETQRCIRTHLAWPFLPEQIRSGAKSPKIIHIRRNTKDTCISYYYHSAAMQGYRGNFEQFCKLFVTGRLMYGPYFANVKSYWEQRDRSNIFLLEYSDLKSDLPGTIKKLADFLEKSITEDEVEELIEHVSIDSMRKHVGKGMDEFKKLLTTKFNIHVQESEFIRKGKEGGYKSVMSQELIEEFDKREKEATSGTDLSF